MADRRADMVKASSARRMSLLMLKVMEQMPMLVATKTEGVDNVMAKEMGRIKAEIQQD
jgi:hypothetical protein